MATTVNSGFQVFHTWLTPSSTESEAAKSHRASIEGCLDTHFDLYRFWRTGSFGNGTSISGYSDVDYLASIPPKNQHPNSTTMLSRVKTVLDTRFPFTNVHTDTPAIVLPFGTQKSEWTEVVPAYPVSMAAGDKIIYGIADGSGGWMHTSPDVHNGYVNAHNVRLNSRLKPLIRFVKAWKYYRNVPISSFYIEMFTTLYATTESVIVYSIDVKKILKSLWNQQLPTLWDPTGIAGFIPPCKSLAQRTDALSKIQTAMIRAQFAWQAEADENIPEAFSWWDRVYAERFPAYG